jgi:G3E family GTPase
MEATASGIAGKLPITLLCGFLGAGKTSLLKHILETQQGNVDFKCAVIVNDMAALNIDKSLISDTGLIQSEEVISMQNGCVCCDLKNDLIEQIIELAEKKHFDYMIIEASGVSEPSEISRLFADCGDDHDHEEAHEKKTLGEVARLDTCVTVVDCHDFLRHLELDPRLKFIKLAVANSGITFNTAQLLVEQIEYSNVIILNKTDLVSPSQLEMIKKHVKLLNLEAKLLTSSKQSPLDDVMEVVDTKLFHPKDFDWERDLSSAKEQWTPAPALDCCAEKQAAGKSPCCGGGGGGGGGDGQGGGGITSTKNKSGTDSKSQIFTSISDPTKKKARHETRFDITSFLYTSRFPFHPERFHQQFIKKYFVEAPAEEDDEEEEEEGQEDTEDEDDEKNKDIAEEKAKAIQEELEERIEEMQVDAAAKHAIRSNDWGGQLVRSKGFLWLGNLHDMKMTYNQAGSMVTIDNSDSVIWNALRKDAYSKEDTKEKKRLRANWVGPYGDRRQELIFIGAGLKPEKIQITLDQCLMTGEEYDSGIDVWKATMGDLLLDDNL